MNDDMLARARREFATAGFNVFLGARLVTFETGRTAIEIDVGPDHRQQYGFAHGGVLAYLVDNAITFASGSMYPGRQVITSEFKINYLRPATDATLFALAEVVSAGRTQAVCQCWIESGTGDDRKLCALGQGTVAVLPERSTTPSSA